MPEINLRNRIVLYLSEGFAAAPQVSLTLFEAISHDGTESSVTWK